MAQRVKRRPKKKNEMAYKDLEKALAGRDINNLTEKDYTELEKLGFGGWMKRNWGNVAQTAGGIGAMFIPGGQAIGASLMSSGVTGMAGDAKEQSALKEQDAQITEMEASTNANNELQNKLQQNPLQNYGVTMRRGGRIKRMRTGGNITNPTSITSSKKTASTWENSRLEELNDYGTLDQNPDVLKERDLLRSYVNVLTEGLLKVNPNLKTALQSEILDSSGEPKNMTIQSAQELQSRLLAKGYGNISLGHEDMKGILAAHPDKSVEEWEKVARNYYTNSPIQKFFPINPKGDIEGGSVQDLGRFGLRYATMLYGSKQDEPQYPWVDVIKDKKKFGGNLKKMQSGGTINYEGQSHEGPNGGIPVDAQGNPDTANPIALTEGKEVTHNGYVFSDTLKYDNDETFAEKIKEEQNKYKLRGKTKGGIFKIHDPYDKVGYEKTVSKMKEQQETLKSVLQPGQEMQELPMARRGGTLPKYSGTYPHSSFLNKEQSPFNIGTQGAYNASRDIFNASLQDSYGYNPYFKTSSPNFGEGVGTGQDFDIQGSNKFSSPTGTEPYQGMNWAQAGVAAAAPVIGSTIGIIQELRNRESNRPSRLNFDRVIPQQISLEEQRSGIRGQGAVARAGTRRGLRGGATSYGQYAGNVGAAEAGISRNVAGGLSESYLSEQLNNAKMRERADRLNAEMDMQEELYNSRIQNQYDAASRGRVNQYISQGLSGITGAIGQKFQSERDADYLNMLNPNYEFVQAPTGRWMTDTFNPKRRMVPRNYGI